MVKSPQIKNEDIGPNQATPTQSKKAGKLADLFQQKFAEHDARVAAKNQSVSDFSQDSLEKP